MNATTEDIIVHVRDWSINKINENSEINIEYAHAVYKEFEEWIEEEEEFEVISLTNDK